MEIGLIKRSEIKSKGNDQGTSEWEGFRKVWIYVGEGGGEGKGGASSVPRPNLGQAHLNIPHNSHISLMSGQKTCPRRFLKLGRLASFFGSQREEIVPSKRSLSLLKPTLMAKSLPHQFYFYTRRTGSMTMPQNATKNGKVGE